MDESEELEVAEATGLEPAFPEHRCEKASGIEN
jgi:hypothetical protein